MRKRIRQVSILPLMCETPKAIRPPKAPERTPAPMKNARRVAISFFLYYDIKTFSATRLASSNMGDLPRGSSEEQ